MSKSVFVLDIGTRTVMALLADLQNGELSVTHLKYKEHKTRSMLDGQIHDVEQVAQLIAELVEEMREESGQELKKVAVAAAGRSLKTVRGTGNIKYPISTVVSRDDLTSLELLAVQDAQQALPKNDSRTPLSQQYYCVGYSIVEERLDGSKLGTILGQKGQEAGVEVVATFLPRIVVDSLQQAIERVGLEMVSITLEPIAVANLVLNPTMRRLNLVLVDIGAGTSDIAVCGGSTISAFGMVPMAGDEITEAISDHYLLDFNMAEEIKRQLIAAPEVHTVDVLGMEQTLQSSEVMKLLDNPVNSLAVAIAREIYELNGKAPQAVLLVGGGSLTPGLPATLAKALEIPENRVAVQQAGKLQKVENLPSEYTGPNFITVLGIAYTALQSPTLGFITLTVNENPVRLLNLAQNYVAEAILASGYNIKDLYGRPGIALTCEINGELYTIPGKPGQVGNITLNGKKADVKDKVKHGDRIEYEPGKVGENAQGSFAQILKNKMGSCTVNGLAVEINPVLTVDGKEISLDEPVIDGCKVEMTTSVTVKEILLRTGLVDESQVIWFNKKPFPLMEKGLIKKNGKTAGFRDSAVPGDQIVYEPAANITVGDFLPREEIPPLEIWINGHRTLLNRSLMWVNRIPADRKTPVKVGDYIDHKPGKANFQALLVDVFNEIKFSPKPPPGKTRVCLMVNGEEKEYTYALHNGDRIQIQWE